MVNLPHLETNAHGIPSHMWDRCHAHLLLNVADLPFNPVWHSVSRVWDGMRDFVWHFLLIREWVANVAYASGWIMWHDWFTCDWVSYFCHFMWHDSAIAHSHVNELATFATCICHMYDMTHSETNAHGMPWQLYSTCSGKCESRGRFATCICHLSKGACVCQICHIHRQMHMARRGVH